ncbi:MAG: ABCB family ABC transporter ATP-binding protein/permease [Methyloligellaceae bacterium]
MSSQRFQNFDQFNDRASHVRVMQALIPFVWLRDRPDLKLRVILAFTALVASKVVTVFVPVAYKGAVDWLTENATGSDAVSGGIVSLAILPIMLIVAYGVGRLMMVVFAQIRDVLFTKVGQNAVRVLADRTFRHLHQLSLRFHLERRTGGLSRVIERGIKAIELIIRMGVLHGVPTLIELAFVAIMLSWFFGWEFVLILAVTIAIYLWFTVKASEWRLEIRRELNKSDTEANSKAIDSLLNYETVKYFGNEEHEARRFDNSMARYEQAAIKTYSSLGFLNSGQALIYSTGMALCMLLAARGVASGTYTVGDFVMINAYLIQLYMPLNFMGMIYRELRQGLVDLENMFALLDQDPEIVDHPDAKPLEISRGHIAFRNVTFCYDSDRTILNDVSFEVPAGKMAALVGPSGAGKSTISRILFRFYEIADGEVLIDGQSLDRLTQESLRAAIGMVPQDTVLFNDTIYYNIRYGRPDASDEEIREAARLAQIDAFIEALPQGYETMVGERGLKLSGGEKQRVAIARTILKAPPILMLDEATSALDSHTEKEIQDALDQISRDRTTLVIAHRLSTVVHADIIFVFDKGQIVEQGTHGELIAQKGLYASMWDRQREAEEARARLADALEEQTRPSERSTLSRDDLAKEPYRSERDLDPDSEIISS